MGKLFDKIRRVQDKTRPFCSAIVPAAGSSARMGGQDKLLADLYGCLLYTSPSPRDTR